MTPTVPLTEEQEQLIKSHSLLVLFGLPQVIDALGIERMIFATHELKEQLIPEYPETMVDRRGAVFWDRWLGLTHEQRCFIMEMEALRMDPEFRAEARKAQNKSAPED